MNNNDQPIITALLQAAAANQILHQHLAQILINAEHRPPVTDATAGTKPEPAAVTLGGLDRDLPIRDLNVTARAERALHRAGCRTAGDVEALDLRALARLKNCGKITVAEVGRLQLTFSR